MTIMTKGYLYLNEQKQGRRKERAQPPLPKFSTGSAANTTQMDASTDDFIENLEVDGDDDGGGECNTEEEEIIRQQQLNC